MTRTEHLKFCKICKNQKFDLNKGIVCNLTNDIAAFEGECSNYEEVIESMSKSEYNNDKCWFCETRPRNISEDFAIYLTKEDNQITIVIPRCTWCNDYRNRERFFWFSPIVSGIAAWTFGTAWTENFAIGTLIGIAVVFLLYRVKLNKNKKILSEYKIKTNSNAIRSFPDVKSKLDEGWKYNGIRYRG